VGLHEIELKKDGSSNLLIERHSGVTFLILINFVLIIITRQNSTLSELLLCCIDYFKILPCECMLFSSKYFLCIIDIN
jgi:hypothetical protein